MQTVTLEFAQEHLAELVAAVRGGEEVVLTDNEQPAVKFVAIEMPAEQPKYRPVFGSARGMITESEDCWEPDLEVWKEYM